jgi:hypothetical protein
VVRRRIPLDAEHARDPGRVRALLEEALAHYRDRHPRASPKMTWLGPDRAELSAHVRGIRLTGHVTLLPGAVEVDVPFLLRPFQGLAISRVEHEVARWLRGDRPG